MLRQKIRINLGPIQVRVDVGDKDGNGIVDVTLGAAIIGTPFILSTDPINLDEALALNLANAARDFQKATDQIFKR